MREIITSSPGCQFAGVATGCLVVSWIESTARSISAKLRPVCIGYMVMSLILLSGSTTKTLRTVRLSIAQRDAASPSASASSIPYQFGHLQVGVGDDRVVGAHALGLLDVVKPRVVVLDGVH